MIIAIIGGGIAGYISAVHLSHYLPAATIYHIYDATLPPIGVGEGTLPSFRRWIHGVTDLTFAELQARCSVTHKRGIRFEGWGKRQPQFGHYFQENAITYHISAAAVTPLLAQYSQAIRLDRHLLKIERVDRQARLIFAHHEPLAVNLVVDARGFPVVSNNNHKQLSIIPTQAALLRQGKVAGFQEATRAVARPHGWIFVIPLTTHTSYGYIYNPNISSQTAVSTDFDTFLAAEQITSGGNERLLTFPNYRQQQFFDGLVYTIGNAASFLEPLEATAIGVILYQLETITAWLQQTEEKRPFLIPHINRDLAQAIDAISLFVGWHYANGSRFDTPFWQFAQANFVNHWQQMRQTAVGRAFSQLLEAGKQPAATAAPLPQIFFSGFDQASFAQVGHGIGYYATHRNMTQPTPPIQQPFSITLLKRARATLEDALLTQQPISLKQLLAPEAVAYLLQVELAFLIKTGGAAIPISQLLRAAQQLVVAGEMPVEALGQMRRLLTEAEKEVYANHAWQPAKPLWWQPLPPLSDPEKLGRALQAQQLITCPDTTLLQTTLGATGKEWLLLPNFLDPSLTAQIHPLLEAAYQNGRLPLERSGVGHQHSIQSQRSDSVRYLTGFEADIWREVPALAVLVQWSRQRLAKLLATDEPLFTPQTAMLSRYPASSGGYAPHIDNPSGADDNGRSLTLVIYLNAPDQLCSGGEIAVWDKAQRTTEPPAAMMAATSGAAVLFNARTIPHQVRPVAAGPARWALSLWFNNIPQAPTPILPSPPKPSLTDILFAIPDPPLPPSSLLFHELTASSNNGQIMVRQRQTAVPRVGLVATVYGEGDWLLDWAAYHLSLGFDHLILIFDQANEPHEKAMAERLQARYSPEQLTIWSTAVLQQTAWPTADESLARLLTTAQLAKSSQAVAARQTLNATAVLQAAQTDRFGGQPLDWLLHLDGDELFYLEGAGRGGATLVEHFATLQADDFGLVRYLNHELLLPHATGQRPRFKVNAALAQAQLGKGGWEALVAHLRMGSSDQRPYFHGYANGKTAVFVPQAIQAAGVHSWQTQPTKQLTLAGPSILHYRQATAATFRQKYRHIAASPVPVDQQLFVPSELEKTAVALINQLQSDGADEKTIDQHLDELYQQRLHFSASDLALLAEANLIFTPKTAFKMPQFA